MRVAHLAAESNIENCVGYLRVFAALVVAVAVEGVLALRRVSFVHRFHVLLAGLVYAVCFQFVGLASAFKLNLVVVMIMLEFKR